jgi:error-prone DNA polymerase
MTEGREVVEDYRTKGLTLRRHPLAFLRPDLDRLRYRPCEWLAKAWNGERVRVAGLVLVRQKPGSAKGTMFITIEDEGAIANLIVWPKVFEANRRLILTAGCLGATGRLQRASGVTHLVVDRLEDLTHLLRRIGDRDGHDAFPLTTGRGDEAKHGGSPDQREALGRRVRDIYIPDLTVDTAKAELFSDAAEQRSAIRVKTRDFR